MSLAGVGLSPEFFIFGFVSAVFTNRWTVGPALVLLFGYAYNFLAVAGNAAIDADSATMLLYVGVTLHTAMVFVGAWLGTAFVYATDFPLVFSVDVLHSIGIRSRKLGGYVGIESSGENVRSNDGDVGVPWRAKAYWWTFFGLVLPFAFFYLAVLMFLGRFTMLNTLSITQQESNVIGGIFLGIGVVLFIVYLCGVAMSWKSMRMPDADHHSASLNLKYAALYFMVMFTPFVFDFTCTDFNPVTTQCSSTAATRFGWWLLASLIVHIVVALLARLDRYFGVVSAWRAYGIFALFWLIQVIMYTSVLVYSDDSSIASWIGYWGLGLFIVLLAVGLYRTLSGESYAATISAQDMEVDVYMRDEVKRTTTIGTGEGVQYEVERDSDDLELDVEKPAASSSAFSSSSLTAKQLRNRRAAGHKTYNW